ncbi:chemotaxis protein CheW [Kistimonas scapharcae]|uniref:Chemotaxis protein CheW n=1 Tax=Kistimonas scapharcae TaxID=1036133 RepID=A0ABP8V7Y5_9GAMM
MSHSQETLSALLIPMSGSALLVPSAALAEMIPFSTLEGLEEGPEWLLGRISWRDQTIPVVSFERANGEALPEGRDNARFAIMNRVSEKGDLCFYALVVQGIPHPLSVVPADISHRDKEPGQYEKACVIVHGTPAVIPDLDGIEAGIDEAMAVSS